MNIKDNSGAGLAGLAALGRNGDTKLAHVTTGEMVVPPIISPATKKIIENEMIAAGLDPNAYTVGEVCLSIQLRACQSSVLENL